ncbi:hypothetical protein WT26_17280 [Burkholderia cepacia]|uniref:Uncharacterized protein n=1 Tax=Burkholderia cepacia TaxID=292 RepID=A0A1B4PUF6_BURCE|nr:hypothetical protein WT26_17280 [Burkholderia cepacia]
MGDGRTRRKVPPGRRQHDDSDGTPADGQFDLFGAAPDDARAAPAADDGTRANAGDDVDDVDATPPDDGGSVPPSPRRAPDEVAPCIFKSAVSDRLT